MISTPASGLTSTSAVVDYHRDSLERDVERDADHGRGESLAQECSRGVWHGQGVELAGLDQGSEVKLEDFRDFLDGKIAGQQIAAGQKAVVVDGKREYKPHRSPGTDFTFSPDRSISTLALHPDGDPRLLAVHAAAVTATMQAFEDKVAFATVNGERVPTGNLAWAEFMHTTARPVDGYVAGHLHTHVVVINATRADTLSLSSSSSLKQGVPADDLDKTTHALRGTAEGGVSRLAGSEIAGSGGPAAGRAGLLDLPAVDLPRLEQAGKLESVLQGDASRQLGPQNQANSHEMRWEGVRADRAGEGRSEGKWLALADRELYTLRRAMDRHYNALVADGLRQLGYEFKLDQHGNARIQGFTDQQIQALSPRRYVQVAGGLEAQGKSLGDASLAEKQQAVLTSREDKLNMSYREFEQQLARKCAEIGLQVRDISRMPRMLEVEQVAEQARSKAAPAKKLDREAERASVAAAARAAIDREIEGAVKAGAGMPAARAHMADRIEEAERAVQAGKQVSPELAKAQRQVNEIISAEALTPAGVRRAMLAQDPERFKFVKTAIITEALDAAVARGELHKETRQGLDGKEFSTYHAVSQEQREAVRAALFTADRLQAAGLPESRAIAREELGKLLGEMKAAVASIHDKELHLADLKKRGAPAAKLAPLEDDLKAARGLASGLSEGAMAMKLKERIDARLDAQYGKSTGDTRFQRDVARLAAALNPETGVQAAKAVQRPTVPGEAIAAEIANALRTGQLHQNAGRLSVEMSTQTRERLDGAALVKAEAGKEAWAQKQAARDAERKTEFEKAKAQREAAMKQRREELVKKIGPEAAAYLDSPTLYTLKNAAIGLGRDTAFAGRKIANAALRRPALAAALLVTEPVRILILKPASRFVKRRAMNLTKAGWNTVVVGIAAGGMASARLVQALASKEGALRSIEADKRADFGKHAVARISTLGYSVNRFGEVNRAALTLKNTPLMAAAMLLSPAELVTKHLARLDDRMAGALRGKAGLAKGVLTLLAGAVRYGLASSIAVVAFRNAIVASIQVTKASFIERGLALGINAAADASVRIARRLGTQIDKLAEAKLRGDHKNVMVSYIKAETAYLAGTLDKASFDKAYEKAAAMIAEAKANIVAKHEKLIDRSYDTQTRSADRLNDAKLIGDASKIAKAEKQHASVLKIEGDKMAKAIDRHDRDLAKISAALPAREALEQKKELLGRKATLDTRIADASKALKTGRVEGPVAAAKESLAKDRAELSAVKDTLAGIDKGVQHPERLGELKAQEKVQEKALKTIEDDVRAGRKTEAAAEFDRRDATKALEDTRKEIEAEKSMREASTLSYDRDAGRAQLIQEDKQGFREFSENVKQDVERDRSAMAEKSQAAEAELRGEPKQEKEQEKVQEKAQEQQQAANEKAQDERTPEGMPSKSVGQAVSPDEQRQRTPTARDLGDYPAQLAMPVKQARKTAGDKSLKNLRAQEEKKANMTVRQREQNEGGKEKERSRGMSR